MRRIVSIALLWVLVAFLDGSADAWSGASQAATGAAGQPLITPQEIEADWIHEELVRWAPAMPAPLRTAAKVTPEQDAAGGVDGLKDGCWGFHTNTEENPWWQVDLGEQRPLDHVLVFNRAEHAGAAARARQVMVLLSDDGQEWRTVYRHDGTVFFGQPDGKPLKVLLPGEAARFVRIQLPGQNSLHLDEVEVFGADLGKLRNVALRQPATQSSTSAWSAAEAVAGPQPAVAAGKQPKEAAPSPQPSPARGEGGNSLAPSAQPSAAKEEGSAWGPKEMTAATTRVIQRGRLLAESLRRLGATIEQEAAALDEVARRAGQLPDSAPAEVRQSLYFQARWAVRRMAFKNPLLDFDDLVFVKRVPGSFTHMSDQYYGWFSRPGGGLFVLAGFKSGSPTLRCLTGELAPGSSLRPDLSYDGRRVLFAYARYYPELAKAQNKLDKEAIPEDAFYHLYEIGLDGTGLRRLTHGKYDDFDGRYLPDGRIVFLSTRRGRFVQCSRETAAQRQDGAGGDCYVRCGGGPQRPVAVYTLHSMEADGRNIYPISSFENFEWTPSIDHEGRILYARWDYVDRYNMPYMKLWSTRPDGTNPQAVFGNFTRTPHCVFETRAIPGSHKLIFTASGHHACTGGPLVLLDPRSGVDGERPMQRLTPEVCFPEVEGWPRSYFAGPYPLSEEHYLATWSDRPLPPGVPAPDWGMPGTQSGLGLYLFDAFGNLNLICRDPQINCETPIPVKPRSRPPQIARAAAFEGPEEGQMLLVDVYRGLGAIPRGSIRSLRVVGVPPKTQPTMNQPVLGATRDDPGKFVLGTVPVQSDGSAYFRVPSGVTLFFQALDEKGFAVQTMRSGFYVQPGQTHSCVGCHEHRATAPPAVAPLAAGRGLSSITPGPDGSWPLDFAVLVQPVLEKRCVSCHRPGGDGAEFDLTAAKAWESLLNYGEPSLATHVRDRYLEGRSIPGAGAAQTNPVLSLLEKGHYEVQFGQDDWTRLVTWMDAYGQRLGSFDAEQEQELRRLRTEWASMLQPSR